MGDSKLLVRAIVTVILSAVILTLCIGTGAFSVPYLASNAAAPTETPGSRPTPNLLKASAAQVGQTAIDFALLSLTGETIWLSDLQGKVVIVTFWATWCPPCEAEIQELNSVYSSLREQGVEILAIDVRESPAAVNEYVQKMTITFPVLLDSRGYLAYAYGVRGIPTSFFIDRSGVLREIRVGGVTEEMVRSIIESIDS